MFFKTRKEINILADRMRKLEIVFMHLNMAVQSMQNEMQIFKETNPQKFESESGKMTSSEYIDYLLQRE